jgi:3-oxoadipate enol-lactonase
VPRGLPGRVTDQVLRRHARSGSLRIAYELRGLLHWRRPWLVLVMGLGFDRDGWEPVLPGLQRRFRLVLIDNRGCGRSGTDGRGFTVKDLAADVIAVMDSARIRSAHVLGVSLGGMVAQEVAIGYPDRVRRLVLACTTPGWPLAHPMPTASLRLLAASRRMPPEVAIRRNVENALAASTLERDPELAERLIQHQRERPTDRKAWAALASAGAKYYGGFGQTRIRAGTLVVHGMADTVVDPRNAGLLVRRIPQAELLMLPDAGHLFVWEDPDTFVSAVNRFLLRQP